MTEEEIERIRTASWRKIGEGAYNEVYVSDTELTINGHTQKWVKKVPKDTTIPLSNSVRAVRKWNKIHPSPKDQAYIAEGGAWIAPYWGDVQAAPIDIADMVLYHYLNSRELILDACGQKNFLLHAGVAKLIDVDYVRRRGSEASDDLSNWTDEAGLEHFFNECLKEDPSKGVIVSLLRSLVYMEKHLKPEEIKDEYLSPTNLAYVRLLRINGVPLTVSILDTILSLPDSEIDKYLRKVIYAHLMHTASLPLIGENENPPAGLSSDEIGEHVKRLKLRALIERDDGLTYGIIEPFLKQIHLELLPIFIEKMRYLVGKGHSLSDSHITALIDLLYNDVEGRVSNEHLWLFITGGEGKTPQIALAAKFHLLDLIRRLTVDTPHNLGYKDKYNRSLLMIALASKWSGDSNSEIVSYFIERKIDLNTQIHSPSDLSTHGLTALDYASDTESIRLLKAAGAKTRYELDFPPLSVAKKPTKPPAPTFFAPTTVVDRSGSRIAAETGPAARAGAGTGGSAAAGGGDRVIDFLSKRLGIC